MLWGSSREPTPEYLKGRFKLVLSRCGPTSVIKHLRELCTPGASVLCLHPDDGTVEARAGERLAQVGLVPSAQWQVRVEGVLPTREDFVSYRRFRGDERELEALHAQWDEGAGEEGFPMEERSYLYLVRMP